MKEGILYGIGVGPGEPELITLKALKRIQESDIIILPAEPKEECYAYLSVKEVWPEIEQKEIICLPFPMVRDKELLKKAQDTIYKKIKDLLLMGKKVGFLTIGDPSIYSTYSYIRKRMEQDNFAFETISGVPSFCAAAAALGISLGENNQEIHIIPASYNIKESFLLTGTKVYMKSGKRLAELKKELLALKENNVYAVSNCGLPNEKHYYSAEELDEESGYLTIVVVKSMTQSGSQRRY